MQNTLPRPRPQLHSLPRKAVMGTLPETFLPHRQVLLVCVSVPKRAFLSRRGGRLPLDNWADQGFSDRVPGSLCKARPWNPHGSLSERY